MIIKFRAWDKIDKKWIDDFKINQDGTASTYGVYHPVSVMLFTGIHDSKDHEIYEGDIVRFLRKIGYWSHQLGEVAEVKYISDQSAQYCGFGFSPLLPLTKNKAAKLTVIGNVYEHPDLLKGE